MDREGINALFERAGVSKDTLMKLKTIIDKGGTAFMKFDQDTLDSLLEDKDIPQSEQGVLKNLLELAQEKEKDFT